MEETARIKCLCERVHMCGRHFSHVPLKKRSSTRMYGKNRVVGYCSSVRFYLPPLFLPLLGVPLTLRLQRALSMRRDGLIICERGICLIIQAPWTVSGLGNRHTRYAQRQQQPGRQTTQTRMNVENQSCVNNAATNTQTEGLFKENTDLMLHSAASYITHQTTWSPELGVLKVISCSVKKLESHLCSCKCSQNSLWRCVTLHTDLKANAFEWAFESNILGAPTHSFANAVICAASCVKIL